MVEERTKVALKYTLYLIVEVYVHVFLDLLVPVSRNLVDCYVLKNATV